VIIRSVETVIYQSWTGYSKTLRRKGKLALTERRMKMIRLINVEEHITKNMNDEIVRMLNSIAEHLNKQEKLDQITYDDKYLGLRNNEKLCR
jgi:hypothetical protein